MTVTLTGIAWDHPRWHDCLVAGAEMFMAEHPGIRIRWDKRSLRDFGEQPITALVDRYDLLLIDHPFCGTAAATGCLVDLAPLIPDVVAACLADSVGASAASYHWQGGVWGLPTDAAAQVSAWRPDLLTALGWEVPPEDHAGVLALARAARAQGKTIAVPLCSTDAGCVIFSLAANLGAPVAAEDPEFLADPMFDQVLAIMAEWRAASHPEALSWSPIRTYAAMVAEEDVVVYTPCAFGYSNYARMGVPRALAFGGFAGPVAGHAGGLLGGAGCALSARTDPAAREAAAVYLRWLHDPSHQRGLYVQAGGQPGVRSAWEDPGVQALAPAFFAPTLEAMDSSYLRPRFDGFVPFFERMGEDLHAHLSGAFGAAEVKRRIREGWQRALSRG